MARSSPLSIFLLGTLVGGAGTWWAAGDPDSGEPADQASLEVTAPTPGAASDSSDHSLLLAPAARRPDGVEPEAQQSERVSANQEPLFSAGLLQYAEQGLHKGWSTTRPDSPTSEELVEGLEFFRESTLALPAQIGRELAERRSNLELAQEDARTGGVFKTLDRLKQGGPGPLTDLVLDRATFDQFFVSEIVGPTGDGPSSLTQQELRKRQPVADGSTLTFPAGVYHLEDFGSYWRDHFPREMTLRGSGMNSTLLVLKSDLSAHDVVRNLTFEGFTVHADDNYLFDIRSTPMSLTLRNVRVTGWDMGAGSSCLFGTDALAVRATNCEFLGGYGRSPGSGDLFDIRHNGLLARFENCLVSRTNVFGSIRPGATSVFSHCRLEDLLEHGRQAPPNITLDSTTVTHWDRNAGRSLARDLNDLFPEWKARLKGN